MTAPSYTEDLDDLTLAEEGTGWSESSDGAWDDQGPPAYQDQDYAYIQGSYSVTADTTKTGTGTLLWNYGSTFTIATDGAMLIWINFYNPNALDTYANGGLRAIIGSGLGTFWSWDVGGSDYGSYPYGGWQNFAVNDTVSADDTVNSYAGGSHQYVGAGVKVLTGIGKGESLQVDAIRKGRCTAIFEYGETANYCTIAGFAAVNDATTARWGLIQAVPGGYLWKGRMSLGTASNAVDFRDSNVIIFIQDTPKVTANFNTIEIINASSNVEMTGFQFIVLDPTNTASLGRWVTTNDATVVLTSCVFNDMNTFVFDSNTTIDSCTFRRCGLVTQAGADIDNTVFDEPTGSVGILVDDPNDIDNCDFISDGTGYSMELDSSLAGGSYTMSGCTWTGYAATDGSTGNECIYNNITGADVTIAVGAGQQPTVHDASTSSTIVTSSVPLYIIITDEAGDPIQNVQVRMAESDGTVIFDTDTDVNGEIDTSYTDSTPSTGVRVWARKASSGATKYKNYSSVQTIASTTGLSLAITMVEDPYNNATS
jgi:hypothetical protein